MSTAPSGFQTPKNNWQPADVVQASDLNRIEGNINAIEQGARTLDQAQAPSGNEGSLRQILSWLANRIRAILGTANWYDSPPTTLTAAKQHIDAAAPHSGHETPTGAQAKVDAHASLSAPHSGHATTTSLSNHTSATNAHSATSAATANRIMMRDSAGRAKVAAPSAADDIARKDTVDAKFDVHNGHDHDGTDSKKIDPAVGLTWTPGRVASGSYTGDGTDRTIYVGFTPSRVWLQREGGSREWENWEIHFQGGIMHLSGPHMFTTDTKCVAGGFTVTSSNGNYSGGVYRWTAIG